MSLLSMVGEPTEAGRFEAGLACFADRLAPSLVLVVGDDIAVRQGVRASCMPSRCVPPVAVEECPPAPGVATARRVGQPVRPGLDDLDQLPAGIDQLADPIPADARNVGHPQQRPMAAMSLTRGR